MGMNETGRRKLPRASLSEDLQATLGADLPIEIVDLSLDGAQVEHRGPALPGNTHPLTLELAGERFLLAAEVMWSQASRTAPDPSGARVLLYRTGLRFHRLSEDAEAFLGAIIRRYLE